MPINTWSKYAYATLEYLPYSIVIPPREYYIIACNKCVFSIRILSTSDTLSARWTREFSRAKRAPAAIIFGGVTKTRPRVGGHA